jgi:hypothetical protein
MKNVSIRHAIATNIKRFMTKTLDVTTDAELSVRSGLPLSTLRAVLDGLVDTDVDMLGAIAAALDVDVSALLAQPDLPVDPLAQYHDQIAALPAVQRQRIQEFIDSVMATYEGAAAN